MALKAKLDTLDGLPDAVAAEYKEVVEGDKKHYVLDAEGIEDVSGLKSALSKERGARSEYEKLLKKVGLKTDKASLDAFVASLGEDTLEEALDKARKAQPDVDAAVKNAKKLEREKGELTSVVNTQSAFIDQLVRENALKDVLADKEIEGNTVLLMPHLLKETKTVLDEDAGGDTPVYKAVVIDAKTKEVRTKGGKEVTLKDLVLEYKSKPGFEDAFGGTGASGSGARPSANPAGGGSGSRKSQNDAVAAKRSQAGSSYNIV
jgi:ribosomal protein L12E/L44/L45/RPP1/RPP2